MFPSTNDLFMTWGTRRIDSLILDAEERSGFNLDTPLKGLTCDFNKTSQLLITKDR